jgi:hypothetical protein
VADSGSETRLHNNLSSEVVEVLKLVLKSSSSGSETRFNLLGQNETKKIGKYDLGMILVSTLVEHLEHLLHKV